jgi:hypothetical protein
VKRTPGPGTLPVVLRSNSPSMLFSWIPVPGTITPEPAPVEAVSEAALPLPSTTEMCVVPVATSGSRDRKSRAVLATAWGSRSRVARPPR